MINKDILLVVQEVLIQGRFTFFAMTIASLSDKVHINLALVMLLEYARFSLDIVLDLEEDASWM